MGNSVLYLGMTLHKTNVGVPYGVPIANCNYTTFVSGFRSYISCHDLL
jgi:hypothetical protein